MFADQTEMYTKCILDYNYMKSDNNSMKHFLLFNLKWAMSFVNIAL